MTSITTETRTRRRRLLWAIPAVIVSAVVLVVLAKWLRELPLMQQFIIDYPGEVPLPDFVPVGVPAWLAWQHGINAFFMLFIIRSGILVRRTQRPAAYFTRRNTGLIKTKNPPKRISIDLWLHITTDTLWLLNGIVFFVLLFSTGQWARIVPTNWSVIPNALSAALQYASFDWPTENGWVNYNSLQVLTYFGVVFLLAPLAILTGVRMSNFWPSTGRLNTIFPVEMARRLHFPIMVTFLVFIAIHVLLVLTTGALKNLNHMYATRDEVSWAGFIIFAASLATMALAYLALRPVVIRTLAGLMGQVGR